METKEKKYAGLVSDEVRILLSDAEITALDKQLKAAEEKRIELEKEHKFVDMCCTYSKDKGLCIGYFQKPTTFTKMQCIDMLAQSTTRSSQLYFDTCIIKNGSDARLFIDITKVNEDDFFYLRALDWCQRNIRYAYDALKKK